MEDGERDEKLYRHDERLRLIEKVVYGGVALVLVGFATALVRLVIREN